MKNNKSFIIGVLVIAAVAYYVFANYFQKTQETVAPAAAERALLVRPHSPSIGPAMARVQLVEFLDPECEACRAMNPHVKRILKEYEGKIHFVVRYMPFHNNSTLAATSLEESRSQGKYWEAMDLLFDKQPEWGNHHNPRPELIAKYLMELGLEESSLNEATLMEKHKWKVDLDFEDGKKLGVNATPTFFINGKKLNQIGYEPLRLAIESELSD